MPEEAHSFASTRARLEEIVSQVRRKDTSLEASLDLLEEGVRLANQCTELIDHADWEAGDPAGPDAAEAAGAADGQGSAEDDTDATPDTDGAPSDEVADSVDAESAADSED